MDPVTRLSSAIFGRAIGAGSCPRPPLLPLLPPVLASCAIRPSRRDTTTADFSCFTPFRQRPYKKKPNPPFWKKGGIQICRWSGEGGREWGRPARVDSTEQPMRRTFRTLPEQSHPPNTKHRFISPIFVFISIIFIIIRIIVSLYICANIKLHSRNSSRPFYCSFSRKMTA